MALEKMQRVPLPLTGVGTARLCFGSGERQGDAGAGARTRSRDRTGLESDGMSLEPNATT
ncbi:MAG: hypothetical protein SOW59_02730 [Corynebacterium sp.]|nr:hypothetical protein [Corynebacterium sp.]